MHSKERIRETTRQRIIALLLIFTSFSVYLLYNIFNLSVLKHDYYKNKSYDQVTTTSLLKAKRGEIYDSNMNVLATNITNYRIFVSPRDIKFYEKTDSKNYGLIIAEGLSSVFGYDSTTLYNKITNTKVLDITIKAAANEHEYKEVLQLIQNNSLEKMIFCEAQTTRYYPEETLLAHTLGFVGSDNQGLFGLEYYYDDILSGEDGYYAYAKDAGGNTLDDEYSSYFPAEDGYSLVTTIDSYIQAELESVIETIRVNHGVENRVCGIVMNTKNGAILGMATSTPFNPNSPFELDTVSQNKLDESGFIKGSKEYTEYKNELLQIMWSNKTISETYEPGSTFKIITVSSALDAGAVSANDTFSCSGYKEVGGYKIKCHKTTGHGSGFSLAYGLQMSCNPCMISVSERLGANDFYSYVEKFGYFEKTGIDLPGEAGTIFHQKENIGSTELATASFGQRFKVSVINHLTAISAIANGGKLVTPYVVDKILDSNGNLVSKHTTVIKNQVVSEEVANTVSQMLIDGVNGDGGAKNAGVFGYDIAAKTGTSEKFDILDENGRSYLRIGSTVAFALNEDAGISMIIVVDEPTSQVKYGSVIAAPYVSKLYEKILPYMEFKFNGTEISYQVENYVGMTVEEATHALNKSKIKYEIVGEGERVIRQIPAANETIQYKLNEIVLYTEDSVKSTRVPSVTGLTLKDAISSLTNAGLTVRIMGNVTKINGLGYKVVEQSLPTGILVDIGETVSIRAIKEDFED